MTPSRLRFSLLIFCSTFSKLCIVSAGIDSIGRSRSAYSSDIADEKGALLFEVGAF